MDTPAPGLTQWQAPPARPALSLDETHIWRMCLDQAENTVLRLRATLAADEQARALRYHQLRDGAHFIVARGALRAILARYLDLPPAQVAFAYGPHGKPRLSQTAATSSPLLGFNLAHSHGLALVAVTCDRNVGVDIEKIRPKLAEDHIAERFFAAGEVASLRNLPDAAQPFAFFRGWTRKEAFLKARGEGLTYPLNGFEVSLGPGEPPALLNVADAPEEASRWSLHEVIPAPGFIGAVAIEGGHQKLTTWDWRPIETR